MSEHKILRKLHIVMFPWFAIGHMTPYIHLANMLAERGHKISYLLPKKAELQLKHLILHPNLVTFHTITVPQADGLPPGTETCSEIPIHMTSSLAAAMDLTRCQVEEYVSCMKPDFVFYDTAHWVPEIAKKLSAKSVCYNAVSAAALAIAVVPARNLSRDRKITEGDLSKPPEGYPSSTIVFQPHEGRSLSFITHDFGDGILFYERMMTAMQECDAIALRTCQEFEGSLCDYLSSQYRKPVFLTGPVLPEPKKHVLEDKWAAWLEGFEPGSVVYCAFGSQHILQKDQFQEMLLGFEMTGLPFLLALKPPMGTTTLEEAMPEGYQERVAGRGLVTGEWVPQVAILDHPSVGCFVSHCGFGSMWESLMSDCQIVLAPHLGDQILNTRLLAAELKVAVEVERKENGWFSKESLSIAINSLMDKDSQEGEMVKKNHAKWRDILKNPEFMTGYVDRFVKNLHDLLE